jgi:transglutaminase-like putative cysteine protease
MRLGRLHRRLVITMAAVALTAFSSGAGVEPVSAAVAFLALGLAFFWSPSPPVSARISRIWPPLAVLLALKVGLDLMGNGGDVVVPVVHLLLLLLVSEALRSEETLNESRLYALTMALLLAATAYRPGALFGLAFAAYVVLASVTIPLGLVHKKVLRLGGEPPAPDRRVFVVAVALSAVTLLFAGGVFLTFPRVARGWSGRGDVMATSIAGFSDQVSIGEVGARIQTNPRVVLRVEFPDGLPGNFLGLHWRGRSYDHFDGTRWTRSDNVRPSRVPDDWYAERWPAPLVRQEIYAAPLDVRVLFGLSPMVAVAAESEIYPMFDNVGDWSYWGSSAPVYTAISKAADPEPAMLREAGRGYMPDRQRYLQLPRLPDRIAALADSITRDMDTRYDQVMAIERYLRTEFGYTRELPRTAGEATLDHFLFERRVGHCEYFSTAMVVMLRSIGIHARNVNGFLGGRWNEFGQYLAVTQNEAHSWVEVWFPTYGWVTFDPTPGASGEGSLEMAWSWPGRFWLDGLQHRWNKWVLDYSMESQLDLLGSLTRWMNRPDERPEGGGSPLSGWLWLLGILPLTLLVVVRRRRGHPSPSGVSRIYLTLVRAGRRAGILEGGPVTPLQLVRTIRERRPEAGEPAERAVQLYTRARFGGFPLDPDEVRALRSATREARKRLS